MSSGVSLFKRSYLWLNYPAAAQSSFFKWPEPDEVLPSKKNTSDIQLGNIIDFVVLFDIMSKNFSSGEIS